MGKEIACPLCGFLVQAQGLSAHQRGIRCAAQQEARALEREGFRRLPRNAPQLRRAGIEVRAASTGYSPGDYGRRSKRTRQLWAPSWAVDVSEALAVVGPRGGTLGWLRQAVRDETFRKALVTSFRLGGDKAAVSFLETSEK